MERVLEGIRIIDLTQWYQGPAALAHLADMGAEVIHVENPEGGDPNRGVLSVGAIPVTQWNSYFYGFNRNKKSLAVNLHTEKGREIIYKLTERSDVFASNMLKGTLKRMGVDYETLRKINPRIIYANISTYGRYGPDREKGGFDWMGQARAGMMHYLGEPDQPPTFAGLGTADSSGAQAAAWAIALALYHRERTGEGQEVDTCLLGTFIAMEARFLLPFLATGSPHLLKQPSRKKAPNPLWNLYLTKDRWIYFCMADTDRFWSNFCQGLGIKELEHDPRFATHEKRGENSQALIAILDEILPMRTAAEWFARWQGLELVFAPIQSFADLVADPQAWENGYLAEVDYPGFSHKVKVRGPVVQLSKTPGRVDMLGPELGQHNEEILVELLGYSWEEVAELKEAGTIL